MYGISHTYPELNSGCTEAFCSPTTGWNVSVVVLVNNMGQLTRHALFVSVMSNRAVMEVPPIIVTDYRDRQTLVSLS
jgi:hypothetical protein